MQEDLPKIGPDPMMKGRIEVQEIAKPLLTIEYGRPKRRLQGEIIQMNGVKHEPIQGLIECDYGHLLQLSLIHI